MQRYDPTNNVTIKVNMDFVCICNFTFNFKITENESLSFMHGLSCKFSDYVFKFTGQLKEQLGKILFAMHLYATSCKKLSYCILFVHTMTNIHN